MHFLIAIEIPADETYAFGVVVPDLPGCFSAGDTLAEVPAMAREAITAHCEVLAEDGKPVPAAQPMERWMRDPEFAGWMWMLLDVPMELTRETGAAPA